VADAEIEKACCVNVDRESITVRADKKKQKLMAECFTDPLFEASKAVYDQTTAASLLLHNTSLQAPTDVLRFVPTLDGERRIFSLKGEEQDEYEECKESSFG
jgi:hypothetical protein